MDLVEQPPSGFDRHPWEVVRAEFFAARLEAPLRDEPDATILDAGAGDGWFAERLARAHPGTRITCYDPNYGVVAPQPTSDEPRVTFTAQPPDEEYSILVLLDVLEHIEDDRAALADLLGHVRPGGHVLISVPAWQRLFSRHDVALRHFRRYDPQRAQALVRSAGLVPLHGGGLFHSLLLARAAQRVVERARGGGAAGDAGADHSLEWSGGTFTSRAVLTALRADAAVSVLAAGAGLAVPGLSWWCLCRKP